MRTVTLPKRCCVLPRMRSLLLMLLLLLLGIALGKHLLAMLALELLKQGQIALGGSRQFLSVGKKMSRELNTNDKNRR